MKDECPSIESTDDLVGWELLGAEEFKTGVHKVYMKRKVYNEEYLQIATIQTNLLKDIFGLGSNQDREEF